MSVPIRKPRICVISFTRLSQLVESVAADYADVAEVIVENRRFGDAVAQAQALIDSGDVDVFISAGANGALLRRQLDYPVILVNVTGYDIMRALVRAAAVSDHIGLITYEQISPELGDFGRLLKIRLELRRYTNETDVGDQVRRLREEGVKVVVGPSMVIETAERQGLESVFIYSPESAAHALEEAIEAARVREVEHERRRQLATILGSLREGVVAIDRDQAVWLANPALCELLGLPQQAVMGRKLSELMPLADEASEVLRERAAPILRRVFSLEGRRMVGNLIPLDEGGSRNGAVLTMQEAASIERAGRDLRRHAHGTSLRARHTLESLAGDSPSMRRLRALAQRFAQIDLTVLISGESGTGKELVAQGLHNASARRREPFVAINCAAMPESLLEAELFGHEEGAFTGAVKGGRAGLLETAHRGSVFLDEIGDMPLALQTRLLRVLQEREVLRVGGREPVPIDVRIIAATHRDLAQSVADGGFREDLYYRLNGLHIVVPSLRERLEDVPLLIREIVSRNNRRSGLSAPDGELVEKFLLRAHDYAWPGNVRELENMVERLMAIAGDDDFADRDELLVMLFPEFHANATQSVVTLDDARRQAEQERLKQALAEAGGNMTLAASRLGIGRTTLWRKLKA